VVIVKASPYVSRIYYKDKYTEDSDEAPDCFSLDGERPDPSVDNPPGQTCAMCPMNEWGSKVSEVSGKKVKACASARRVAVLPAAEMRSKDEIPDPEVLRNEDAGGLMLLRVPTTAMADLKAYAAEIKRRVPGHNYNMIVTRLAFDPDVSYPKPVFKPLRKLTESELAVVAEMADKDRLQEILMPQGGVGGGSAPAEQEAKGEEGFFEEDVAEEEAPAAKADGPTEKELAARKDEIAAARAKAAEAKLAKAKAAEEAEAKAKAEEEAELLAKAEAAAFPAKTEKPAAKAKAKAKGGELTDEAIGDILSELEL
jgi:hypothetical protein